MESQETARNAARKPSVLVAPSMYFRSPSLVLWGEIEPCYKSRERYIRLVLSRLVMVHQFI